METPTAIITGGAQGFGKAFAEHILKAGGKTALLDRNVAVGLDTANELNQKYGQGSALFIACDVTERDQIKRSFQTVIDTFGHYNLLVNNAGIPFHEDNNVTLSINLAAVIEGSYLGLEHMNTDNGGQGGIIVNVASTAGLMPTPGLEVYCASKAGVVFFSRSLAQTAITKGVKVLCLCPSFARTNLVTSNLRFKTLAKLVDGMGMMEVSEVVTAFDRLLSDSHNGSVMAVTPAGIEYRHPRKLAQKSKI